MMIVFYNYLMLGPGFFLPLFIIIVSYVLIVKAVADQVRVVVFMYVL